MSNYIADWLEWGHQQRKAQEMNPSPAIIRIRFLKQEIEARKQGSNAQISNG